MRVCESMRCALDWVSLVVIMYMRKRRRRWWRRDELTHAAWLERNEFFLSDYRSTHFVGRCWYFSSPPFLRGVVGAI